MLIYVPGLPKGSPAVALFDFAPSAEDELRLQAVSRRNESD